MATLNITDPDEFLAEFNQALNAAPSSRLRHIIRDVCRLLPAALPIVSDCLLVSEDQVPAPHDPDSNSGSDSGASVDTSTPDDGILEVKPKLARLKSKKRARVRARYAVCANCGVEYDVTKNTRESCCFHPEEAVADEEYWERIDLWEDEEIDTEESREDHPEGFVYGCCGRHYGEEECKVGWHEEESGGRKRRRL
ncbi:hypothetical protein Aspvir_008058 [Aspergillus viridinutans]|uniref:Uncharacterized protein n=1 Tax=Aspergillus viridinutans TaxID=75553 RepID=A0A9P3BWV3_ASPVI|nr:uncharacterized protein Aspvir_008058 [Aspergillus viridinutans]GIK03983.1 hypothetical protein Aspvir_008058 [Aspergillus viridinutans]